MAAQRTSAKRLIVISITTIAVCLLVAAGVLVYERYFQVKKSGGPGTQIVKASEIRGTIYELPDGANQKKPLSELVSGGHGRKIVVEKSKRLLSVYVGSKKVKTYFCALGWWTDGPKTKRNDGKTPEGTYYVCSRNPRSSYELSLLISYPNVIDAAKGCEAGLIDQGTKETVTSAINDKKTPPQDTALGSFICIHGGGIGRISSDLTKANIDDWTAGCIALRSEDIKEVYEFGDPGTVVEIRP